MYWNDFQQGIWPRSYGILLAEFLDRHSAGNHLIKRLETTLLETVPTKKITNRFKTKEKQSLVTTFQTYLFFRSIVLSETKGPRSSYPALRHEKKSSRSIKQVLLQNQYPCIARRITTEIPASFSAFLSTPEMKFHEAIDNASAVLRV
jgi:hypothetical protein